MKYCPRPRPASTKIVSTATDLQFVVYSYKKNVSERAGSTRENVLPLAQKLDHDRHRWPVSGIMLPTVDRHVPYLCYKSQSFGAPRILRPLASDDLHHNRGGVTLAEWVLSREGL